ncbi:lipopolysaccharide assembly protein LapA domain-containing protein [uncultured Umboniibacter sp.]|uniref:lipopolysaccharide assembly protein LapA domain-containing protein n=1 Tax=uncultured Umboniibacter sp. TaxID=1798917 RepID=UPI0026038907|nr:lipopolysaccharide assembly protein LapA domain-containing protein [uncultured Umboniibacter sp.]
MQRFFKALRKWFVIVVCIAATIFAAAVVMLNAVTVEIVIPLLQQPVDLPLGVALIGAFICGLGASLLLLGIAGTGNHFKVKRLQRELDRKKKSEASH